MAYEDTPNKAKIRRDWDYYILANWFQKQGSLTYFGLTGPEIRDLIDWQDVLDKRRTGIESPGLTREDKEETSRKIARINMNLMLNGMLSGYQQLIGDVEDVIINAVDTNSDPPQINDAQPAHLARFGYDVVNLDFDGGLGYKKRGRVIRIDAIKRLFERQRGHSFVLFVTINVRHRLGEEINDSLRNLQSRNYDKNWHQKIGWYIQHPKHDFKLKAVVPALVNKSAETNGFRCTCHPPIAYIGHENAHMVHFTFELENVGMNLPVYGPHDDWNLIDLPLLRSDNGTIRVDGEQHPGFPFQNCSSMFSFLPQDLHKTILNSIPS